MKLRTWLMKLVKEKRQAMDDLKAKSAKSEDINEVRAIGETLETLKKEIEEAEAQLAELDDEGDGAGDNGANDDGQRAAVPANAVLRNGVVVGSFAQTIKQSKDDIDHYDTKEYRTAFMNYVCRNVPIPTELRDVTTTADAGAVIPTTILNEIIQSLDSYGNVYALVRKLNVQGGVSIPISSLKPVASWIGETAASADQKLDAKNSITFSYFGVECKIAQTLLANVVTLDAFQKLFVPLATEAIVKALEVAIFNGTGGTQPTGILKDARVPEANVIEMTEADMASWSSWHKKVKAKMKKAYRNGTFFLNQATFDGYIDGMEDKNGQPVGRTNYGINGEETYRFMGKAVETVEDECLAAFEDAEVGDIFGVFMKPTDYAINSNLQMTTVKWTDHDTNEIKNKCILICDGKLVDANGVLLLKKAAATV